MAQTRNLGRNDRIISAVSTGDGGSEHPDHATQTLLDHIKEKKVDKFFIESMEKKSISLLF